MIWLGIQRNYMFQSRILILLALRNVEWRMRRVEAFEIFMYLSTSAYALKSNMKML